MWASLIISAHNEGDCLSRTVGSCVTAASELGAEILIADDASSDGSVEDVLRRFPRVRVSSHPRRRGVAATKDMGARKARGRLLVFLDGHTKPEPRALERLLAAVVRIEGRAIITPRTAVLDDVRWENGAHAGYGYVMTLEDFHCGWIGLDRMRRYGSFYECPALIGCCLALSRKLYRRLSGFDRDMVEWGVEDLDFGLKSWLMGHPILLDPHATVGHRFRTVFDNFSVTDEAVLSNQIRAARKNFTDKVWNEWLHRARSRQPPERWNAAWQLFLEKRRSAERERRYLLSRRLRDESWYAERFGLEWPVRAPTDGPGPTPGQQPT